MTVPQLRDTVSNTEYSFTCPDNPSTNALGETPLPYAPLATLDNGHQAVPQQYLKVQRSLENLELILERIEFSDHYILFAGQNADDLYLQIGIIGVENYPHCEEERHTKKIVYGRRWLIEPSTPTSEVIQTAMLAIKKAREHELREKFTLHINQMNSCTTPFNNHMDLPLMAGNQALLNAPLEAANNDQFVNQISNILPSIKVGPLSFELEKVVALNELQTVISLQAGTPDQAETLFPELSNARVSLICDQRTQSAFLHELMAKLIYISEVYVEENFRYQNFSRFSRQLCPAKVANFSYETRNIKSNDKRFNNSFKSMSYAVDSAKTPSFSGGKLGMKQRERIEKGRVRGGHFPKINALHSNPR